MRKGAVAAVLLLVGVSSGCGGSSTPTAPSVASVAGNWQGTVQLTAGGSGTGPGTGPGTGSGTSSRLVFTCQMSLTQGGTGVSGTYAATNLGTTFFTGTVTGSVTSNAFSGTFTWVPAPGLGPECAGTFMVSGPAGGNTLNWTSPGVVGSVCTGVPTNMTISGQHS